MKHLILVVSLIGFFLFVPNVYADTFFIDADCLTPGNGTTPTCANNGNDSFDDTLDFTETGRNAGDIAIHRRGTTALYDDGTDLFFTSDGSISNPITLEADYDDNWGDFASSSQTYTPNFGSKTMTASASITGIAANDWVYFDAEDQREFSYEVSSVSGTTLTLFLPYKGSQSGSGNVLNVMPDAPIWGTPATAIQWDFNGDFNWKVQGLHIRGTDGQGNVELDSSVGHVFKDVIFEGNGANDFGIRAFDDNFIGKVLKSRFFNHKGGIISSPGVSSVKIEVEDSLFDGNDVSTGVGMQFLMSDNVMVSESEFKNHVTSDLDVREARDFVVIRGRNLLLSSTGTQNINHVFAGLHYGFVFLEDHNGVIGDNQQFTGFSTVNDAFLIKSTTTPVRSGGGATSIEVHPSTFLSSNWEISQLQLFEYPIYTDTTSRDYQVFFKSGTSTGAFTASPTATELWIECEYWGTSSGDNHRRLLKSTATMDFTTDSDFDQSLTITCNPSQTGILYLRAFYAKTKETGRINEFFVDPRPVITDT